MFSVEISTYVHVGCAGTLSIRQGGANAHLDCFVLGLWLEAGHGQDLAAAGFDGFYTYFASDGFSFGSSSRNWPRMCSFARERGLACTLSVGPGYQDDKIRPWNAQSSRPRREGAYYDSMWRRALEAGAEVSHSESIVHHTRRRCSVAPSRICFVASSVS